MQVCVKKRKAFISFILLELFSMHDFPDKQKLDLCNFGLNMHNNMEYRPIHMNHTPNRHAPTPTSTPSHSKACRCGHPHACTYILPHTWRAASTTASQFRGATNRQWAKQRRMGRPRRASSNAISVQNMMCDTSLVSSNTCVLMLSVQNMICVTLVWLQAIHVF
jgi:hypothetical protein